MVTLKKGAVKDQGRKAECHEASLTGQVRDDGPFVVEMGVWIGVAAAGVLEQVQGSAGVVWTDLGIDEEWEVIALNAV